MKIEISDTFIQNVKNTFEGHYDIPENEKEWNDFIETILEEWLDSWGELED